MFFKAHFKISDADKRIADIKTMNQSGSESHSTERSNSKKFTVKKLKFAPEIAVPPTQDSDGSAEGFGKQSPQSPTSPGPQFTYGYATNEAIPMTVFYRNQHSQGHSGKQRPTLQQLRKGFENDRVRELMLFHKINYCISQEGGEVNLLFLHESSCKISFASIKCEMFSSFT